MAKTMKPPVYALAARHSSEVQRRVGRDNNSSMVVRKAEPSNRKKRLGIGSVALIVLLSVGLSSVVLAIGGSMIIMKSQRDKMLVEEDMIQMQAEKDKMKEQIDEEKAKADKDEKAEEEKADEEKAEEEKAEAEKDEPNKDESEKDESEKTTSWGSIKNHGWKIAGTAFDFGVTYGPTYGPMLYQLLQVYQGSNAAGVPAPAPGSNDNNNNIIFDIDVDTVSKHGQELMEKMGNIFGSALAGEDPTHLN